MMVRLSSGSFCNSFAIWKEYSFSCRQLGGNVPTKQIFMGPIVSYLLEERESYHRNEARTLVAGEVQERLLRDAEGKLERIFHSNSAGRVAGVVPPRLRV